MKGIVIQVSVLFAIIVASSCVRGQSAENPQPLESHPPETVEHPSVADDTRGIIVNDSPDGRAESGAPEFPGGIGGGEQKMYMGMFQMMAMPMKAPEMPSIPNMPSIPGIGGQ